MTFDELFNMDVGEKVINNIKDGKKIIYVIVYSQTEYDIREIEDEDGDYYEVDEEISVVCLKRLHSHVGSDHWDCRLTYNHVSDEEDYEDECVFACDLEVLSEKSLMNIKIKD